MNPRQIAIVTFQALPHFIFAGWCVASQQTLTRAIFKGSHYESIFEGLFAWGFFLLGTAIALSLGFHAIRQTKVIIGLAAGGIMTATYALSVHVFAVVGMPSYWGD